jgi:cytochrome c
MPEFRMPRLALLLLAPMLAAAAPPPKAFDLCATCHTGRPDALGPDLREVFGRKAASVEGYRYSGPMRRSGLTWDGPTLLRYLQNPQQTVPGTKMPMSGIPPDQARAIVEYLEHSGR